MKKPDFYYQLEDDEDEILEIEEALERGELTSVENVEQVKAALQKTAENYFARKDKRITLRLSGGDLALLKARAAKQGLPYQTMIASVLHQYVTGQLVEK